MFSELDPLALLGAGALASFVVLLAGLRMTGLADRIADRTGFGEAVVGGVLLGAATSFSGTIVSLSSALDGRASLAFSNGVGGIAAQTAFLALADVIYRRANLEHAAAELANIYQCGLLLVLLSVPFLAYTAPDVTIWAMHPASIALPIIYIFGVVTTSRLREQPMWKPVETSETRSDTAEEGDEPDKPARGLILLFLALMLALGGAGWVLSKVAGELVDRFELSASVVGALLTAVITSLPELVTTLAAVRRGALQLAVGGIIGGNTFDTLFLTVSDAGLRSGSLYHVITVDDIMWLAVGLLMSGVLLLGLIFRQREGPGGIGGESLALILIYLGAIGLATF